MLQWILDRLKEPSTLKGLAALAGALGLVVSPDQWQAISVAVVAAVGVVEVFRKEKPPAPPAQ